MATGLMCTVLPRSPCTASWPCVISADAARTPPWISRARCSAESVAHADARVSSTSSSSLRRGFIPVAADGLSVRSHGPRPSNSLDSSCNACCRTNRAPSRPMRSTTFCSAPTSASTASNRSETSRSGYLLHAPYPHRFRTSSARRWRPCPSPIPSDHETRPNR
jgi:hypothetical protein